MFPQLSSMLFAGSVVAALLGPATPSSAPTAPSNPATPTIRTRVEEVRVSFTVEDDSGPLRNLSRDAFTIYDDTQAVSPITAFNEDSDLPLEVGLLLDRSDSVRKEFPAEQAAAQRFFQAVLRPGLDSIFLLDFTHELRFRAVNLSEPQTLAAQVHALAPGGQTALYDALYAAAHFELMTENERQAVRRAIILLSDGEDNYSRHDLSDAIAAAQRSDISIYSITVHPTRGLHSGDAVLESLAQATGGRAFILPNLKRVEKVFSEIDNDLRNEYSIAFQPALPRRCGYHRLLIQPHDPRLRVRARQGYYNCQP